MRFPVIFNLHGGRSSCNSDYSPCIFDETEVAGIVLLGRGEAALSGRGFTKIVTPIDGSQLPSTESK
jgi:hypothetical protein